MFIRFAVAPFLHDIGGIGGAKPLGALAAVQLRCVLAGDRAAPV
ncbi:hypothetical protein GLA29479_2377 [Lysobacter antibioticus]|nr:hypothetical protein [Lysobacter antibioticus]ALN63246.1 hypothetical protein GLA29479_2377 [Lysobacter antibioticus]